MKKDNHNNLIKYGSTLIDSWCVIKPEGEKQKIFEFLQGQVTSDINNIDVGCSQLSSICNHKGQIMSDFIIFKSRDDYKIIIDKALKQEFIKELEPFAKFFSVKFKSLDLRVIGEVSKNKSGGIYLSNNTFSLGVNLIEHNEVLTSTIDIDEWNVANKLLGNIFLEFDDIGKYRPQELNFDKLRVSFNKGCFRGQEIVARMKYIGVDRRKFCLFITETGFIASDEVKIIGKVIYIKDKQIFNAIIKKDRSNILKETPGIFSIN